MPRASILEFGELGVRGMANEKFKVDQLVHEEPQSLSRAVYFRAVDATERVASVPAAALSGIAASPKLVVFVLVVAAFLAYGYHVDKEEAAGGASTTASSVHTSGTAAQ